MKLGQKQELFSMLLGRLLRYAYRQGYAVRCGELHRPPEMAAIYAKQGKGIKNSLHTKKLAVDLFVRAEGSTDLWAPAPYEDLGKFWKDQHELARWGGDFKSRDMVHYSIEHAGVK